MNRIFCILAQADSEDMPSILRGIDPATLERSMIFGAILLVVLGVFAWAMFWRKPRRRSHSDRHHRHAGGNSRPAVAPDPADEKSGWRRKRRRRREHRPRNPTLAETGGLPPPRVGPPTNPPA